MINYNLTTVPDTLKMLQAVEETTDVGASVAFTCYYSIFSIVDPATYSNLFAEFAIIYNLLYNLGFMYTDVQQFIELDPATFASNELYWH